MELKGPRDSLMSVAPETESRDRTVPPEVVGVEVPEALADGTVPLVKLDAGESKTSSNPDEDTVDGTNVRAVGILGPADDDPGKGGKTCGAGGTVYSSHILSASSSDGGLGKRKSTNLPAPVRATSPSDQTLASTMPVSVASDPKLYRT